jgi:LuxR family transcriptional regulator, maltose regulon positive regulatory protein
VPRRSYPEVDTIQTENRLSVQGQPVAVPRSAGSRVQRAGLLRRLESASEPLMLLVAASGFGKTSLLAQWATTTDAQVAWLSCEESDGDPAQFWSRLIASLAARWPAMGSDAALILERPSWDDPELVDSLARDLADVPATAAIVIDDAQFAEESQTALARLAQRLPAHVRFLVASQHNPVFSTSRLRLAGVITELRADDLAFTQVEVEQLLELVGLGQLPVDSRRLRSLTEGWPAGLQMAVLAMRGTGDPDEVIDAFASTTQETSDYLANEVLNRLPPDLAGFLLNICVLEEFDAPLCQAVTGQDDAGRLLGRVIANDLFIYQVDIAGERFRLHPMFTAFLRARLKSLGGTSFREAHLRAAAALQERGDRLAALRHAMAVADMQLGAAILVDSMLTILEFTDAQEAKTVARAWLAKFGDAAAEANPEQLLQFALPLASSGHREAQGWLTKVNQTHPSPAPGLDAMAHGTWAAYYVNQGSADLALEHNRLARLAVSVAAGQGPVFPMLAQLPIQEAGAHLLAGDLPAATAALHSGPAPLSAPIADELRSPVVEAWVAFLQGDLVSAGAALDRVAGAGAEYDAVRRKAGEYDAVTHGVGQIFAYMVKAGLHLERQEHRRAADLLTAARAAARINGRPVIQTMVDTWIARLATAEGDRTGALASLTQARLALTAPDDRVRAQHVLEEFRIAIALAPAEASALIPRLPPTTASAMLQARLHILRREWAKAEQMLEDMEPLTVRDQVEWGVLQSLAAQEADLPRAHRYLRTALTLASPHRYLATIIEQGPGIAALLRSLPAGTDLKPYIDELSVCAEAAAASSRGAPAAPAAGLLSDRELTVLRLLSSRLTTTEITGALYVSPNTLKSHMKSIYRKLDVSSRADAVREGAARGLL